MCKKPWGWDSRLPRGPKFPMVPEVFREATQGPEPKKLRKPESPMGNMFFLQRAKGPSKGTVSFFSLEKFNFYNFLEKTPE